MTKQHNELTLQETEQLCSYYMDCRLSVLQENELRYLLSRLDYHSPLIDDTRKLMGIELKTFNKPSVSPRVWKPNWWTNKVSFISVAASFALLIGIGVTMFYQATPRADAGPYYVAYLNGHQLNDEASKRQIEEDMRTADAFISEMSEYESQALQMSEQFFND